MSDSPDVSGNEETQYGELSNISEKIGDLVTGIPAPIRKSAFKAFGRLCTSAIEYPVALIQNAIKEKRAESQARVTLINTSADKIAAQMQINRDYVSAAAEKFAHKIVRERINIDNIAELAAKELQLNHGVVDVMQARRAP